MGLPDGHIEEVLDPYIERDDGAARNVGIDRELCGEDHAVRSEGIGGHYNAETNAVVAVFDLGIDQRHTAVCGHVAENIAARVTFKNKIAVAENEPKVEPVRLVIAAERNGNIHGLAGACGDRRCGEDGGSLQRECGQNRGKCGKNKHKCGKGRKKPFHRNSFFSHSFGAPAFRLRIKAKPRQTLCCYYTLLKRKRQTVFSI